ncbi:MAG: FRG domain-containing protein [Planctomycetota bacterium]
MPNTAPWECGPLEDGVQVVTLGLWAHFADFVLTQMLDYRSYLWRGQASGEWPLKSTFDRLVEDVEKAKGRKIAYIRARQNHLKAFQLAARGRCRDGEPAPDDEYAWWALGQHHGLATPLLDWTESAFVALYFAFLEEDSIGSEFRGVYAFTEHAAFEAAEEIITSFTGAGKGGRPPCIEIYRPPAPTSGRLVNQRGLFLRMPDETDLESWVRKNFAGEKKKIVLFNIRIPDQDRKGCLRFLNRMNINHLSLFPDLDGAAQYCNADLAIEEYQQPAFSGLLPETMDELKKWPYLNEC